ncbi:MAG TPA: CrcB family protein [Rubrobacter sp.]
MKRRTPEVKSAAVVAQATLRLRSELQCERVIRLAHSRGVASATAYRGPEDSPIFVMLLDEAEVLDRFLPELREVSPEAPISVIRESVEHVSPADFLRGGVIEPRPFRAEARHLGWVFAGGALGAGARLLVESAAAYADPSHAVFPWGTMLVNVIGSFAIAVLGALIFERFMEERERMFWVLGFLGSFTTFSSYALQMTETWAVSPLLGTLYGGGSIFLGLLAALLGLRLTRALI